jgi:Ni2+-binding GTPase involved in maturation of urease and hydrogenase
MNDIKLTVAGPLACGKTHLVKKVLLKALADAGYSVDYYYDEGSLLEASRAAKATHHVIIETTDGATCG